MVSLNEYELSISWEGNDDCIQILEDAMVI